jgi:putative peptidoglycan lipid II flippase
MPPRVLSYTLNEFQKLILGFLTTSIGGLSFFSLRLAMKLMVIPIRLFGVPIGQASLSFLAHESDQKKRYRQTLIQSIHQVTFLATPASVLLLILRVPIVRLVFGAKNLPWDSTLLISRTIIFLALSVTAQAIVQLLIRAFHALEDTITPFIVTTITVITWVVISAIGIFYFNQKTVFLAGTTGLTAVLELGLFLIFLEKKVRQILTFDLIWHQLKIATTGFLMAVFLYLPFKILDELIFNTSKTIELIALTVVTSTIGGLVYVYFAALFDISELKLLTKVIDVIKRKRATGLRRTTNIVVETTSDETLS